MIILISPAKTFSKTNIKGVSKPYFYHHTIKLVKLIKNKTLDEIKDMFNISFELAKTTFEMYQNFDKQLFSAIHLYNGQAFKGLNIKDFDDSDLDYLNKHLYILSGLYGLLKPNDQISLYRLDFKDSLDFNLYSFWKKKINDYLNKFHHHQLIINLASEEYSKILIKHKNIITIDFIQEINGVKKSVSMYTKLSRGMLASILIKSRIETIDQIKNIEFDGYKYSNELSSDLKLIFYKKIST